MTNIQDSEEYTHIETLLEKYGLPVVPGVIDEMIYQAGTMGIDICSIENPRISHEDVPGEVEKTNALRGIGSGQVFEGKYVSNAGKTFLFGFNYK